MIEDENGRVSGSIDRARVSELLGQTTDEALIAHYQDVLGDSAEGKAASEDAGEQPADSEAAASEDDVELDDLRAQAEALGVKVDGRWGEQRLREEIAAAQESEDADGHNDLP